VIEQLAPETVISVPDIFGAAKLVIDQDGEDAPLRAARRSDELRQPAPEPLRDEVV